MDVGGLDYSVRKKLDTQYLRDMTWLEDRIRQVEHLKKENSRLEKAKINRHPRKEKIANVETNDNNQEFDVVFEYVKENEINMAELQPRP